MPPKLVDTVIGVAARSEGALARAEDKWTVLCSPLQTVHRELEMDVSRASL